MGAIAFKGDIYPNGSSTAKDSVFDNTGTDLESTNAEDAIKEVDGKVEELSSNKQDKTDNSLATTAKTVVGAINEVNGKIPGLTTYIGSDRMFLQFGDNNIALQIIVFPSDPSYVRLTVYSNGTWRGTNLPVN